MRWQSSCAAIAVCVVSVVACGGKSGLESGDVPTPEEQIVGWKDQFDEQHETTCPADTPTGTGVCSADFGAKYPLVSEPQVAAFRLGRWRVCAGSFFEAAGSASGPLDVEGIEFFVDGSFVLLRSGPDGSLVAGGGMDYEGKVVAGLNGPSSFFLRPDSYIGQPTTGYQVILVGSLCPRKIRLQRLYYDGDIELAPD